MKFQPDGLQNNKNDTAPNGFLTFCNEIKVEKRIICNTKLYHIFYLLL